MENNREPYRENEPWGEEERFACNEVCTVKILTVNPGESLSLQKHEKRDEFWKVLEGEGWVTVGDEKKAAKAGDEYFIPRSAVHRLEGGALVLKVLEISFGEFDKEDEVRLEDKYGRA